MQQSDSNGQINNQNNTSKQRPFQLHSSNNISYRHFIIDEFINGRLKGIESKYKVKFIRKGESIEVEANDSNIRMIRDELENIWRINDFQRSTELSTLIGISDYRLFFNLSPVESVALRMRKRNLLTDQDLIDFKIDNDGTVCVFGRGRPVQRIFDSIQQVLPSALPNQPIMMANRAPYVMTINVPEDCIHLFMGRFERWLEETLRCSIDVRLSDANLNAIPVDIITNNFTNMNKVNRTLIDLADRCNITNRDWLYHGMKLRRSPLPMSKQSFTINSPHSSGMYDLRLVFKASSRRIQEIIINNADAIKLIEQNTNCHFDFNTTAKYSGNCSVEINTASNIIQLSDAFNHIDSLIRGHHYQWNGFSSVDSVLRLPIVINSNNSNAEISSPCTPVKQTAKSSSRSAVSTPKRRANTSRGVATGRTKPIKLLPLKMKYADGNSKDESSTE